MIVFATIRERGSYAGNYQRIFLLRLVPANLRAKLRLGIKLLPEQRVKFPEIIS